MQRLVVLFLSRFLRPGLLVSMTVVGMTAGAAELPAFNEGAVQAWWKALPADADFVKESQAWQEKLREAQDTSGVERIGAMPNFMGWLEMAGWLELAGAQPASFLASPDGRAAFAKIGADSVLRKMFLANLSAFDDAPKAAEILCHIVHAEAAGCRELPQLAVATALVWDQPFPENWPHPWVKHSDLPLGDADPVKRFHAFLQVRDGFEVKPGVVRKLAVDPKRLTARDLMFVIDTPLELKELAYILQIPLSDPRRLNDLFKQVPYDTPRMSRDSLLWQNGMYRLIDIGTKGGICADQAYFVSMAGKAQGIPSIMLQGQGTTGGHAWVGYMGSPGKWSLDVARYREGKYTSGVTWDPQTWRRITDSQLVLLNREPNTTNAALKGRLLARWALMNKSAENYPRLLGIAREAWPHSFDVWQLQAACLEERKLPPPSRKLFWENWVAAFKDDPDMRFQGQCALLRHFESLSDAKSADALRTQIVTENKRARFDLASSLAAAPILDLGAQGKWPQAWSSFEKFLQETKGQAEGNLFYNLVQPFIEQAAQAGENVIAENALKLAKPRFQIVPLSTLAVDFKALENLLQKQ